MVNDTLSAITEATAQIKSAVKQKVVGDLSGTTFSVFINTCKWKGDIPHNILEEASTEILSLLVTGDLEKESQTLAATAFCSVQCFLHQENPEAFFNSLDNILRSETFKKCSLQICNGVSRLRVDYFTNLTGCENRDILLQSILDIVFIECNKLNSSTYLAFDTVDKILSIVTSINGQGNCTSSLDCLKPLISLVLANLENPIPGVRQKNFSLLQSLLVNFYGTLWEKTLPLIKSVYNVEVESEVQYRNLLELVLTNLPWTMKSKFFLLRAVAQSSTNNIFRECYGAYLVEGMLYSLSNPYLVSAGADLYRATLFCDLDNWIQWFFVPISHIISHPDLSLTVENLFSYWFPSTSTTVPDIVDYLLREVSCINLYSYITLLKLSRKGGYSSFDWKNVEKSRLQDALEDYSDKIRSQAFSLICSTNKTSVIPTKEEFLAVRQFLKQNINSDNTAFRQKLLSSFTDFSIRIRDCILTKQKGILLEQDVDLTHCFAFLDWLHSFFIFNLEIRCNYQRKITTLELYGIVLTYFGKPVEDMGFKRKSNKAHLNLKTVADTLAWTYVFESELYQEVLLKCLFDEDSNVRDLSAKLLLKYFDNSDFMKPETFENLFQNGLSLCSSQIFYKAESGALLLHYLLTLAEKSCQRYIECSRLQSFISDSISSAEEQFIKLQKDMLKAISEGSFLYGTLRVLRLCSNDKGPLEVKPNHLKQLLLLMEEVVKYFMSVLSSKSNPLLDSAPSFGEMGEAISALVNSSSLKESWTDVVAEESILASDSASDLHLTPAQQLVLNCIWLNLKECCTMCSKLVENQFMDYESTERCTLLVISILRKCRHKGAIEAAGSALSHIVAFLTRQTNPRMKSDSRYIKLPEKLMNDVLESLIKSSPGTVSRRSAGLGILVHKLIAADARISKPLLPHCVEYLVSLAEDTSLPQDPSSLVDLPQSQAMHLLRALVQDAGLKQHLLPYYLDICMVTLSNLVSTLWTIRNAALQLFGAVVPKLVGQKPQDEENGSQYLMFEEMFSHTKPLVYKLLDTFNLAAKSNSIVEHNKIMPILTLITNLNVGLLRFISEDVAKIVLEFQQCFQHLFKSQIVNVRKLSAKGHAQFEASSTLVPSIRQRSHEVLCFLAKKESSILSTDQLHGCLLNVTYLVKRFDSEKFGMKLLNAEEGALNETLSFLAKSLISSNQPYFIKLLAFEWKRFRLIEFDITEVYKNVVVMPIGFSYFVEKYLTWQISTLKETELENTVAICLKTSSPYDLQLSCLNALKVMFKNEINPLSGVCNSFKHIFIILRDFTLECSYSELISLCVEVMFYTISNFKNSSYGLTNGLFCKTFTLYSLECLHTNRFSSSTVTYILPVVCGMLSSEKNVDLDLVQKVVVCIKSRCDPTFDQDVRIHSAKAMTLLVPVLKSEKIVDSVIGELLWEVCVDCLQDEVLEVRYEASQFVSDFFEEFVKVKNPFVSLEYIFKFTSITKLTSPEKSVESLWRRMMCSSTEKCSTIGLKNPFDHEKKNIFAEEFVISNMAYQGLIECAKSSDFTLKLKLQEMCNKVSCDETSLANYVKEIKSCVESGVNN